jgi:exonuclease SbcD
MKLIHTADWHLGKRLHKFSLQEEQEHALAQIIEIARSERPDAVIVAGDVFDTQVPTLDALSSWEHVTGVIVGDLQIPMIAIPGNHDHPERLGVHSKVAQRAGLHIVKSLRDAATPIVVGDVQFYGLPFHKPAHVNSAFQADEPGIGYFDYHAAMAYVVGRIDAARQPGQRAVLIAHAFIEGAGEETDGEDPLHIGGAGAVNAGVFENFDYVALGHIHGRRKFGAGHVYYSGTPYPYSFSEAGQEKTVTMVDMSGDTPTVTPIALTLRRAVRRIEDLSFEEVIAHAETATETELDDYVLVRVTDRGPLPNALQELRAWYPNSLLEQPRIDVSQDTPRLEGDVRTLTVEDAFRQFYDHAYGEPLDDLQEAILREVLQDDDAAGEEVSA